MAEKRLIISTFSYEFKLNILHVLHSITINLVLRKFTKHDLKKSTTAQMTY